jgi:hypothetical protein
MTTTVNFICVKHEFSEPVGRVLYAQVPNNATIPVLMKKILEKAEQTIASVGGDIDDARVYQLTPSLEYSGLRIEEIVWEQLHRTEMSIGIVKQLGSWPRGHLHALVKLPGGRSDAVLLLYRSSIFVFTETAAPVALPLYESYASCFSTVDGSSSESSLLASRITVVEAADTRYKHSRHYSNFKTRLEAKRDVHTNVSSVVICSCHSTSDPCQSTKRLLRMH